MLFEVTVLAFDQVACGVENKKICPTTRARARLIVKVSRIVLSWLIFSLLTSSLQKKNQKTKKKNNRTH